MITSGRLFDEDMLLAKINNVAKGSVTTSESAEAGQIPVADGEGGFAWGAAVTGTVAVVDPNSDGNLEFQYTEGD